MKILAIIGASRHGNTAELVRYFEGQLKEKADVEFEYLFLCDYPIDFCTGCHLCIFEGEERCPHSKNVNLIEAKITECDGLIMASPGYMFSVTGIMKNFLDHVAYNCHRPKYFNKKVFLLASCNDFQQKSVFLPMENWANASGFSVIGKSYIDMLPIPLTNKVLDKKRSSLKSAVLKFYNALKSDKTPKPVLGSILIFRVFRTLCSYFPEVFKADFDYYNKKKAYDKGVHWFMPVKLPFIKHLFAKFIENRYKKDIRKVVDQKNVHCCKRHINRL